MYSETRLTIQEIDHTDSGNQLSPTQALVYRTSSVQLSTEARVSAAQLTAEIPYVNGMVPKPGSMVILEATNDDGEFVKVFVGYVFTYSVDRWGVVSLTAYDAIRYLQNPASGKWMGKDGIDVSEIVRDVVRSCGLEQMANKMQADYIGVKPIRLIKIAEKGIDIIDELLEWAQLKATADENGVTTKGSQYGSEYAATRPAGRWMLIDNLGTLVLCNSDKLAEIVMGVKEPPIIGTGCAVTEMNMNVSIDECANQVWLLRAGDAGIAGWEAKDPNRVKQWGPLTYYEKIDNAFCRNDEQMKLRAAIELCTRDIEKRQINITTLGLTGLRAGMLVRINIPWLEDYFGEVSKSKLVFLDSVSHTWEEGTHTMTFSAEALPGDVDLEVWKRMTIQTVPTIINKDDASVTGTGEIAAQMLDDPYVTKTEEKSLDDKYFCSSRNGKKIQWIVCHYPAAPGRNKTWMDDYYKRQKREDKRQVSAHYAVDDTGFVTMVPCELCAWHVATSDMRVFSAANNKNSIGIDLMDNKINTSSLSAGDRDWYFTEATLNQAASLIAHLMQTYGIPLSNVIRHYDVTHKECPRPFVGNDINEYYHISGNQEWDVFKQKINALVQSGG